VANVMAT